MDTIGRIAAVAGLLIVSACAQVPKESVELSTTVGRDLLALQDAHRQTALELFQRMLVDVDRFVDDTYAPYQIQKTLEQDRNDPSDLTLHKALERAGKPGASAADTRLAVNLMQVYVEEIRADIAESCSCDPACPCMFGSSMTNESSTSNPIRARFPRSRGCMERPGAGRI